MSLKEFDAASGEVSGTATTDSASATSIVVSYGSVDLDLIALSNTNPRTSHGRSRLQVLLDDPAKVKQIRELLANPGEESRTALIEILGTAKLAEFVMSIAVSGVNQPVLLRPLPANRLADTQPARRGARRPEFELVAGERRFFGTALANRGALPAMIKPMSDQEVLEFQLIENLQRDDLHPMEEAEGYLRLCETTGISKEEVAKKIGKSRSYVYQNLQLLKLGQEARDMFREGAGGLDFSKALLLAGVADPKLQLKALKEVTAEGYAGQRMTVRAFRDWLQQNVMLKLDHAPFDTQDMLLIEAAGACGGCPKRTGANRDIFAAFDSPDMCTDAKCYGQKATISLQRIKDAAAEKGMKVIAGVEAKKLMPYSYHQEIKGYTRLDDKVDGGTIAKVLGKDAPTPVLFVDPHTQKQIKVLPTEVVGELLKAKGVAIGRQQRDRDADEDRKEAAAQRAKREARYEFELEWRRRAIREVNAAVRAGALTSFTAPVLRLLLDHILDDTSAQADLLLLSLWGLPASAKDDYDGNSENSKALERHIAAAPDLDLGRMVLDLLMAKDVSVSSYRPEDTPPAAAIDLLALEAGVADRIEPIKRDVKAAAKAAKALADGKKKPAKASGATPLAAQAQEGAEGEPAAPAVAKKPRGKAAKLSAEEAKSGIAEAMQGVDRPAGVVKAPSVSKKKRAQHAAFMAPLVASAELAAIVGSEPMARTEVVSKLWAYVKKHKLQDATNKRMINADEKLQLVFGKSQVSMFEMAGLIGKHVHAAEIPGVTRELTDAEAEAAADHLVNNGPQHPAQGELGVGVQVRVNGTVTAKHLTRWIGRSGLIEAKQGDGAWFVRVNKNARIAFDHSELDVVRDAWPFPKSASADGAPA